MGEKDVIMKQYLSIPEIFADFFNGVVFGGEQILQADRLVAEDGFSAVEMDRKWGDQEVITKYRDVIKKASVEGEYVILGIENQMNVHYGMPIRCMLYDALHYTSQAALLKRRHQAKKDLRGDEFLSGMAKKDRLKPVITFVIYYGSKPWNGAGSVYELLEMGETALRMLPYISDYKVNFIDAHHMEREEVFHSGLREFFGFMKHVDHGKGLEEYLDNHRESFYHMDADTFQAISILADMQEIYEQREQYRQEQGGYNMCQAVLEIKQEGIQQGIEKGIEKGIEQGIEQGFAQGQWRLLLASVRKAAARGNSVEILCGVLDGDEELIRGIYEMIMENNEITDEEILSRL